MPFLPPLDFDLDRSIPSFQKAEDSSHSNIVLILQISVATFILQILFVLTMTAVHERDSACFMAVVSVSGNCMYVEVAWAEPSPIEHSEAFRRSKVVPALLLTTTEHDEVAGDPSQHMREVRRAHHRRIRDLSSKSCASSVEMYDIRANTEITELGSRLGLREDKGVQGWSEHSSILMKAVLNCIDRLVHKSFIVVLLCEAVEFDNRENMIVEAHAKVRFEDLNLLLAWYGLDRN